MLLQMTAQWARRFRMPSTNSQMPPCLSVWGRLLSKWRGRNKATKPCSGMLRVVRSGSRIRGGSR
jgi:hypothetical protein